MTSSMLFNVTTFVYLISTIVFFAFLASKNRSVGVAGSFIAYAGLAVQTVAVALLWASAMLRCPTCMNR